MLVNVPITVGVVVDVGVEVPVGVGVLVGVGVEVGVGVGYLAIRGKYSSQGPTQMVTSRVALP